MATENKWNITRSDRLDWDDFSFSELKKTRDGKNIVYVNYGGKPLRLQFPRVRLPFGVSQNYNKDGHEITIPFGSEEMENNEMLKGLYDMLLEFDERLLSYATKKSQSLFGKVKKREVLEDTDIYTRLLRVYTSKKTGKTYDPSLRLKIPQNKNGVYTMEVYDNNRELINMNGGGGEEGDEEPVPIESVFSPGCTVRMVIQLSSIWFVPPRFGYSARIVQVQVFPSQTMIRGFAMEPDEGEGDDDNDEDVPVASTTTTTTVVEREVEDDEGDDGDDDGDDEGEDDDDEEEPEPVPEPVVKVKKTTARKGTTTVTTTKKAGKKPAASKLKDVLREL